MANISIIKMRNMLETFMKDKWMEKDAIIKIKKLSMVFGKQEKLCKKCLIIKILFIKLS